MNTDLCDSKADVRTFLELGFSSPNPVYSPLLASLPKDSPVPLTSFRIGTSLFPKAACSISGFHQRFTKISLPVILPRACGPAFQSTSGQDDFLCQSLISRLMDPAPFNNHLTLRRERELLSLIIEEEMGIQKKKSTLQVEERDEKNAGKPSKGLGHLENLGHLGQNEGRCTRHRARLRGSGPHCR